MEGEKIAILALKIPVSLRKKLEWFKMKKENSIPKYQLGKIKPKKLILRCKNFDRIYQIQTVQIKLDCVRKAISLNLTFYVSSYCKIVMLRNIVKCSMLET